MSRDDDSGQAFAYLVPANPHAPHAGMWSTLVRRDRVHVGDRIALSQTDVSSEGTTIHGSRTDWEVLAIEPTENDGRRAGVRGFRGPNPVWDGRLVGRPAD